MAHTLFGADLLLAPPDGEGHSDSNANSGSRIDGIVAADDNYAWQQCTQELGETDHSAGLVDYLGTLPVLESGVKAPIQSPQSYKSCAEVNLLESVSTQLTMFYAGTVNVCENVTADKAQIDLSFAKKSSSMLATTSSFKMQMTPPIQQSAKYGLQVQEPKKRMQSDMQETFTTSAHLSVGETRKVSETGHAKELASLLVPCQAIVPTALPIARKASLAQFLEKRKERVRLMAPYVAKASAGDNIHQAGAYHSNASSTLHKYYKEYWGGLNAKELGCASAFAYGKLVDVEDHDWLVTSVENAKQASECGSAA